jgi:hypothetical protein
MVVTVEMVVTVVYWLAMMAGQVVMVVAVVT